MKTCNHVRGQRIVAAVLAAVAAVAGSAALVLDSRPVGAACPALPGSLPAPGALPASSSFPDPFAYWDGTRLTTSNDWACRRAQLAELAQYYEYGHLPPAPAGVTGTRNGNTLTVTVQANGRTTSFNATLNLPAGSGPFPAFILLNPLAASATARGYAEIHLSPNSIAADSTAKTGAFWNLYGGSNVDTGVLMAWAWGVHRTLDALTAVPQIDRTKVGVSGYSRYGKAALVAGAFDERIAMTVPGSSGTAGMGNYRFFSSTGSNNETLEDILGAAYWFTPRFAQFRNQSTRLPFDQHSVAALVAPRLLLTTNGTEGSDIRTNPLGTSYTYRGAQMVYQYIGARERIGIAYRPGGHQIDILDYNAIMDFADKYLKRLPVSRTFDNVPYPAPTPAQITWTIPPGTGSPSPSVSPSTSPSVSPSASPSVSPSVSPSTSPSGQPGACTATYRVVNNWGSGFQAEVAVTNPGPAVLNGWTVRMTLAGGQTITNLWNGVNTGTSGQIGVRNAPYNGTVAANASTTFGYTANGNGSAAPTGITCTSP